MRRNDPSLSERVISAYRVFLPEQWYGLPLSISDKSARSLSVAEGLTGDPAARSALASTMDLLVERLVRASDGGMTAAVYIPRPELGQISCVVGFELTPLNVIASPDDFQQSLMDEASARVPGTEFRANRTWRAEMDDTQLVGAESLILRRDLTSAEEHLERRVVFGVFPARASQLVQFVFSTDDLSAFRDMAQETQAIVDSLEIEFEGTQ